MFQMICSYCLQLSRQLRPAGKRQLVRVDSQFQTMIARARKDFKESDRIRDELATMGVSIKDGKDADGKPVTTWEIA